MKKRPSSTTDFPTMRQMDKMSLIILTIAFLSMAMSCVNKVADPDMHESQIAVLENESLRVRINHQGAELQTLFDKKSGKEILWIGDSAYWQAQSPVMFPVNVRFKDEKYTYKGKEFEMPRMGLAVINTFDVAPESNAQKAIFSFNHTPQMREYYPFDFQFKITYELVGNELINKFQVSNEGTDTMYFALGGHPGFNCPFKDGLSRGNYEYVFPKKLTINRTEVANSLVQPNEIPYLQDEDRLALNDDRIPNGGMFLKGLDIGKIGIARKGEDPFVKVDLGDFPNVNLWSPPGMPYACIEPMVSHHDVEDSPLAIEEKTHLVQLLPQETKEYQFTIIVPE